MLPETGLRIDEIVLNKVVFPAPFAPIKVTIDPSFTSRLIPFNALIAP